MAEIQLLEKGRKSPGQFCYPLYPNTSDTPYICQDKENVAQFVERYIGDQSVAG